VSRAPPPGRGKGAGSNRSWPPSMEAAPDKRCTNHGRYGIAPETGPNSGKLAPAVGGGGAGMVKPEPDSGKPLSACHSREGVSQFVGSGGEQAHMPPGPAGDGQCSGYGYHQEQFNGGNGWNIRTIERIDEPGQEVGRETHGVRSGNGWAFSGHKPLRY
jgi:hypothetical protein